MAQEDRKRNVEELRDRQNYRKVAFVYWFQPDLDQALSPIVYMKPQQDKMMMSMETLEKGR